MFFQIGLLGFCRLQTRGSCFHAMPRQIVHWIDGRWRWLDTDETTRSYFRRALQLFLAGSTASSKWLSPNVRMLEQIYRTSLLVRCYSFSPQKPNPNNHWLMPSSTICSKVISTVSPGDKIVVRSAVISTFSLETLRKIIATNPNSAIISLVARSDPVSARY